MGSRKTIGGVERIYQAAVEWRARALQADDSLFTPGESIWTAEWIRELRTRFLDGPGAVEGQDFFKGWRYS